MTAARPNILLIVADCGRADRWLDPRLAPTLAALRRRGISFSHAIVEKACTSPSFASLLTGRFSPRHGVHNVWGDRLAESVPLLTSALAAAGYQCVAEMTGPLLPELGLARGFEQYVYRVPAEYLSTAWGDALVQRLRGGLRAPWFMLLHLWELHHPRQVDGGQGGPGDYDRAVTQLDAQLARVFDAAGDALIVFTGDHGEKLPEEQYRPGTAVAYAREALRIDEADGILPGEIASIAGPSVLAQFYGLAAPLLRDVSLEDLAARPARGRMQQWLDRARLLALVPFLTLRDLFALRDPARQTAMIHRRGLLDAHRSRTKIDRLTSLFGRNRLLDMHMRMWLNSYKHNLVEGHMLHVYDFLVRVPFVIVPPPTGAVHGVPAGATIARMVRQVDFMPTVLDLVGVPVPDDLDGRSLRSLLAGEPWTAEPAYLSVSGLPRDLELRGVRTEAHKLTYGPHNAKLPVELYDLAADPGETRNIAGERPDLCAELRAVAEAIAAHGPMPAAPVRVSPEDQARIEQQLRDLGYIE